MVLPVYPNPISIDNLRTEFGVTGEKSLQDFYAGGGIVPANTVGYPSGGAGVAIPSSGAISLNNFHGASAIFVKTFSSNTQDVNLRSALIADGWDQNTGVIVNVNQGVWITSDYISGSKALTIVGPFPNGLTINLNGIVAGGGGNGLSRYWYTTIFPTSGETAVVVQNATVTINIGDQGAILGGGGGGAGWFAGGGGGAGGGLGGQSTYNYGIGEPSAPTASGGFGPSGLLAPIVGQSGSETVQNSTNRIGGGGSGGWTFAPNATSRAYGGLKPGFDDGTGNPQNTSTAGQGGFAGGGGGGYIDDDVPVGSPNIGFRGGNGGTSQQIVFFGSPMISSSDGQTGFGESAQPVPGGGGGGGGWGRKGGDSTYQAPGFETRTRAGALPGNAISIYSSTVTIAGATGNTAGNIVTY